MARFNVGALMKDRKQMRERANAANAEMQLIQTEVLEVEQQTCRKRKLLCGMRERLRILDEKVETILVFAIVNLLNEKV